MSKVKSFDTAPVLILAKDKRSNLFWKLVSHDCWNF